jgi:D-alanyl-D-alanine carboxypeptidase
MATRLRDALDPNRWSRYNRQTYARFRARSGLDRVPPRIAVRGAPDVLVSREGLRPFVVHRSKPLTATLKRMNSYSNNDIERFGEFVGGPEVLASDLQLLLGEGVQVETLSGLGTNRMTPRQIVQLFAVLQRTCERLGLRIEDVLPTAGCDPGTLEHFPRLARGAAAGSVVAKTGTLTTTDGGIAVLAGIARAAAGDLLFAVAQPRAGRAVTQARTAEESWILERVAQHGGPRPAPCGAPVVFSDDRAEVEP